MKSHMKAFRSAITVALLAAAASSPVAPAGAGGKTESCPTPELDLPLDAQTTLVLTPESCGPMAPPFSWKDCLEAHDDITDFLVTPGDYSDWGTLEIDQRNGLPNRKRVIRYDGPSPNVHPVQRAEKGLDHQAIIHSVKFTNAHHWIIHGLTVTTEEAMQDFIQIFPAASNGALGSSNIILDYMLVEHATQNAIRIRSSDDNCVQNSVIRNAVLATSDRVGVHIKVQNGHPATGNRIVNNEILNYGDAIHMNKSTHDAQILADGTIIADNDLYVTPDYLDLLDDGNTGCIENAIDLKIASSDPGIPVRIHNNRIWGYRKLSGCGGSGEAMVIQQIAKHIQVCQNVIFDVPMAIRTEIFPDNMPGDRDAKIERNLFYGIQAFDPFESSGSILRLATPATLHHNTFSHSHKLSFQYPNGGLENVFEDNVVIAVEDLDHLPDDFKATNQVYSEPPPNAVDFTFLIKRWTGSTTMTLPLAVLIACPWDCGDGDGQVGIVDFLALLAQWGQGCAPCDIDGGGVGITDFLVMLANWGACP
jgi:hypothetical protein